MKLDERVRERLAAMIEKGEAVLGTHRPPHPNVSTSLTLDTRQFTEWRNQALVYLEQIFGMEHTYVLQFKEKVVHRSMGNTNAGIGILHAAHEDVDHGYLETFENLVTGAVFSDFLEQSQHLLENGYKSPAASLAGAVLENGLRSLAERKGIPTKDTDNLETLNRKIVDKRIYNRLRQKQVETWIEVRNAADHGRFDDFGKSDVGDLIKGVRDFLAAEL